ncbi:MAG TPA: hypothetical protein VD846_00335 [Allosphingosinicella sp.]|nr:hypothetical protein [Allosphingosinicella sp.]
MIFATRHGKRGDMEVQTRQELAEWLQGRPRSWSEVIAVRAALRVMPLVARSDEEPSLPLLLSAFRAVAIGWTVCSAPHLHLERHAEAAAQAIRANKGGSAVYGVRRNAVQAVHKAIESVGSSFHAVLAGEAAEAAVEALALSAYPSFAAHPWADDMERAYAEDQVAATRASAWAEISNDCAWLDTSTGRISAPTRLSERSLRLTGRDPDRPHDLMHTALRFLPSVASHWEVWADWHQRRVEGHLAGFDIPGDKGRGEDLAILIRLAAGSDETFWGQGPQYVNVTLGRWLDEARARAAGHRQASDKAEVEAIARDLEHQASPEARIVDGKLDAGPNQRFDAPRYSRDLAELPSILLVNAEVLRNSLPTNASGVVGRCLDAYRDELQVRGNRPILSILKAMTSAIRAEVFVPPSADLEEQPDRWRLRDAREWGAGTADLFKSFFRYHLDLISHFPLDPEREARFEATPVDEAAASGSALTEPVEAVAALIRDLADRGFATENIVQIIEAHQRYTRDVAQLPPSQDVADVVSPKRRHVLSTAGFYLSAYAVLGSTASIAPFAPALLDALRSAAAAMLSFIR